MGKIGEDWGTLGKKWRKIARCSPLPARTTPRGNPGGFTRVIVAMSKKMMLDRKRRDKAERK
jgi:hypothetical protein